MFHILDSSKFKVFTLMTALHTWRYLNQLNKLVTRNAFHFLFRSKLVKFLAFLIHLRPSVVLSLGGVVIQTVALFDNCRIIFMNAKTHSLTFKYVTSCLVYILQTEPIDFIHQPIYFGYMTRRIIYLSRT